MRRIEQVLGRVVTANNDRMARAALDRGAPNPRDLTGVAWHEELIGALPALRAEWDRFAVEGPGLPRIEELIDEHQGNDGDWRAGLLVSRGRPVRALADHFPQTQAALASVPGVWSGLWSVLGAGAELHEHVGPNRGVLRYHLGIDCGQGAALRIGDDVHPYRDGGAILFDDTEPHAAWNRGDRPRVTLFLEVLRPAAGIARIENLAVQRLLALDPRYRKAPSRAEALHRARSTGQRG